VPYHYLIGYHALMSEQPHLPVVTTEAVPGCRVAHYLGYVEGGGAAVDGTSQAITAMVLEAHRLGANAVIGVRWSHGSLGTLGSGAEHAGSFGLVYGTAVVVEPEAAPKAG
jgi:uncharacterized protein YbjQ (UPF0145 family)